jgi:hypothetical protein
MPARPSQPGARRGDPPTAAATTTSAARFPTNCKEMHQICDSYKKSMLNYLNPIECRPQTAQSLSSLSAPAGEVPRR